MHSVTNRWGEKHAFDLGDEDMKRRNREIYSVYSRDDGARTRNLCRDS